MQVLSILIQFIFLMGELWKTTEDPYRIATFGILPYLTSIKLEPVVSWTLASTIFIEKEPL